MTVHPELRRRVDDHFVMRSKVARELQAVYVWGAQTGQARKRNVFESTINAIREGHSRGVPAENAQIIDFTRDLICKHRVDEAIVKALRERFGERAVHRADRNDRLLQHARDRGKCLRTRSYRRGRSIESVEITA